MEEGDVLAEEGPGGEGGELVQVEGMVARVSGILFYFVQENQENRSTMKKSSFI